MFFSVYIAHVRTHIVFDIWYLSETWVTKQLLPDLQAVYAVTF